MKIGALDLGTTWAFADNRAGTVVIHEVLQGKRPQKLAEFTRAMQGLFEGLDVVVYERPFARGQAATRLLWAIAGIIEAAAHDQGVAVLDMTPGEIKEWSTGFGRADKPAMMQAAFLLGYEGDNEHEADAWCLLRFAEATLSKELSK
jgi:Holliday junction resolvasome RuvABC endonuclease subunit